VRHIVLEMTEDTARVNTIAVCWYAQEHPLTRDTHIARQIASVLAHEVWPDTNPSKPMRMTDEPMPIVRVEVDK